MIEKDTIRLPHPPSEKMLLYISPHPTVTKKKKKKYEENKKSQTT